MSQEKDFKTLSSTDPELAESPESDQGSVQNPEAAAQTLIEPEHAAEEEKTVYMGGGTMAGAAAGAVVGTAVAGPLGTFVGAIGGGVAGALGGAAAGALSHPAEDGAEADPAEAELRRRAPGGSTESGVPPV